MQMLEPDFWRGKGRYSKQAICRSVKDKSPYRTESDPEDEGSK